MDVKTMLLNYELKEIMFMVQPEVHINEESKENV